MVVGSAVGVVPPAVGAAVGAQSAVVILASGELGVGAGLVGVLAVAAVAPAVDPACLLYTSAAAAQRSSVDLGGRRIL